MKIESNEFVINFWLLFIGSYESPPPANNVLKQTQNLLNTPSPSYQIAEKKTVKPNERNASKHSRNPTKKYSSLASVLKIRRRRPSKDCNIMPTISEDTTLMNTKPLVQYPIHQVMNMSINISCHAQYAITIHTEYSSHI